MLRPKCRVSGWLFVAKDSMSSNRAALYGCSITLLYQGRMNGTPLIRRYAHLGLLGM